MENPRPEHRPGARLLFVRRTFLSDNRIHAIRRSQSVSPGTRRPDRGAGAAVRENAEVRCGRNVIHARQMQKPCKMTLTHGPIYHFQLRLSRAHGHADRVGNEVLGSHQFRSPRLGGQVKRRNISRE